MARKIVKIDENMFERLNNMEREKRFELSPSFENLLIFKSGASIR